MIKQLLKTGSFAFVLFLFTGNAYSQLRFNRLDSLLAYANQNSSLIKISSQQSLLAKWTKVAALANSINFKSPLSFSATDNLQLPVNFIPAEVFGGPAGTFRQITLGQQYVSNFNFAPQLDIINPFNLARVKSAEINKELTELNNQLNKKALFESIAAAYYNCVMLKRQISITEMSLSLSDSVLFIVGNKFNQGIARKQDLNNAEVNTLLTKDKLQQLQKNLDQQLNIVKILCDIPPSTILELDQRNTENSVSTKGKAVSSLQSKYNALQGRYAQNELRANRWSTLPILSLVYFQGWQKNSNSSFFDSNASWIQSKYIGLRITVPFPPDVNKLSQNYTSKINYNIAGFNADHSSLQNELSNRSLDLDYEKTLNSYEIAGQIAELKNSNYQKSLDQYREGIISTDLLLNAFTDFLTSQLNVAATNASMENAKSKISINNSFQ